MGLCLEISPSVHILPEKCAQTDAHGGCKWSQLPFGNMVHDVATSRGFHFWYCTHVSKWVQALALRSSMLAALSVGDGWWCFRMLLGGTTAYFVFTPEKACSENHSVRTSISRAPTVCRHCSRCFSTTTLILYNKPSKKVLSTILEVRKLRFRMYK